jgi:O-antigen/teichoic acid export membrane protein
VLGVGSTAVATSVLARILSPDDFGRFMLFGTIMTFGASVAVFGVNIAGLRFISERLAIADATGARRALRLSVAVCAVASAVLAVLLYFGLSAWGVGLFHDPKVKEFAFYIVASAAGFAVMQVLSELLRGFHDLRFASLLNGPSGGALAMFLFVVSIMACSLLMPLALSQILQLQAVTLGLTIPIGIGCLGWTAWQKLGTERVDSKASLPDLKLSEMLRVCIPLMLTQLLTLTVTQSDIWIGGVTFSKDDLALYAAARRLMIIIAIPAQMALLTVMSSIPTLFFQRRLPELQRMMQSAATVAALPSLAALILLVVAPSFSLGLVYGDFYRSAALPLVILGLGQGIAIWGGTFASYTLAVTGHHNSVLSANAVTATLYLLVGPLVAARFGLIGLATMSALLMALQSLALWALTKKMTGVWSHASVRVWWAGAGGSNVEL